MLATFERWSNDFSEMLGSISSNDECLCMVIKVNGVDIVKN
jgi:hypothetical protein